MDDLADLFQALSHPARLRILHLFQRHGEVCGCDVEAALGLSQSAASRHLRRLADAGIVRDRRDGFRVLYRLAEEPGPGCRRVLETTASVLEDVDPGPVDHTCVGVWRRGPARASCPGADG